MGGSHYCSPDIGTRKSYIVIFACIRELAADHAKIQQSFIELLCDLLSIAAGYMIIKARVRSFEFVDRTRQVPDLIRFRGEKAHSLYFSKDAYAAMIDGNKYTENKELMIIPDAVHTDLYYKFDVIPFDKIVSFFNEYLK